MYCGRGLLSVKLQSQIVVEDDVHQVHPLSHQLRRQLLTRYCFPVVPLQPYAIE